MVGQVFRKRFNKKDFIDLIIKYSEKRKNQYIFSNIAYKKAVFNNDIKPFIDGLKEYYYKAKKFYVERTMNYKFFLTVLRQVCKYHSIPFIHSIKYSNSTYEIQYSIFIYEEKLT